MSCSQVLSCGCRLRPRSEKHMRQEREAAWEDGVEDGREQLLQEQIRKKLAKGKSITEIADALEETEDMIRHQIEKMEETEK